MGRAFKELAFRREDLVVSTKIFWFNSKSVNEVGLSRKHIVQGLRNCLKRLQLEYVDVVFCHRPEYDAPLEETCAAFNHVIEQGWSFYWGTSEWPADRIAKAIEICDANGWHKPIVEQCEYNMLTRDNFEKNYRRLFKEQKYGTTIWSPLASGILAGKYNDGNVPEGSRFDKNSTIGWIWSKYMGANKDKTCEKLRALGDLAKEYGATQAALALAWAVANQDVSTCILGFSRLSQVDENLKAIELYKKWNKDIEGRVKAILDNEPEIDMDWRTWSPAPQRREESVKYAQ